MARLRLWEGLSLGWGDKANFEEYAGEALPVLEKQVVRAFGIALFLFIAGLVAVYYGSIVLSVALLLLALYFDQQSNKSHLLLVLTAYHRSLERTLEQRPVTRASV